MDLKLKNCCSLLNTLLKHKNVLNPHNLRKELNHRFLTKATYFNFNYIQKSMDKFSEQCIRESIKNTMLKHEEIFKQQVCELHRLYQVQKLLMAEQRDEEVRLKSFVGTSNPQNNVTDATYKLQSSRTSSEATHSSHASDRNNSKAVLNSGTEAGHSSQELFKYPEPLRASKAYILQNHIEGESIESCSNEECNLDLSLSIGCASNKMEIADRKMANLLSSNLIREESGKECTDSSGGFGAESLKRPHWLFQALSLNRT